MPCRYHSSFFRILSPRMLMLQISHPCPHFILLHAFKIAGRAIDMVSIITKPGRRLSTFKAHLLCVYTTGTSSALIRSPDWSMLRRISWIRKRLTATWDLCLNFCLAFEDPSLLIYSIGSYHTSNITCGNCIGSGLIIVVGLKCNNSTFNLLLLSVNRD